MSKGLALAATGIGGGGIAITGSYALGAFGGSAKAKEHSVEFENIDKFEEKKGGECVSKLMPGTIEDMKKDSISETLEENFFGDSNDKDKSCLVIDWQRTNSAKTPKDRENIFTLTWAFVNSDNKGMVIFFIAKVENKTSLSIEAKAYAFGKDNDEWKIKHRKKITKSETANPPDYGKHFPKTSTKIKTDNTDIKGDYWGFIPSDNNDSGMGWRKEFTWEKQTSPASGEALTSWAENPDWIDQIFSDWKLKDKLGKFTGKTWKKEIQSSAQ